MNETKETTQLVEQLAEPPALSGRWTICALLFVATSINYMDRQVLSILKPIMQKGDHPLLTDVSYGWVLAAFQVAYGVGVLFAGWFIDRVGCRKGYPIVTGIWSLSAMAHSLVTSVWGFVAARVSLGIGESGNFPAAIKATAEWFPPRERALATGIFNSGASVGAILAPAVVPWVAMHYGWRAAFLITGGFSILWIICWSIKYRTPAESMDWTRGAEIEKATGHGPSLLQLLGYKQTWAFVLGKFLTDPVWWFFLFWLPQFFSNSFHLPPAHLGLPLIIVYVMSSFGSIFGGWLPRGYVAMGFQLKKARMMAMLTCGVLMIPVVLVGGIHNIWTTVAVLSLAAAAHQGWSANMFTTASDMFPAEMVGKVVSFGQVAAAVGGALFQVITGHLNGNFTIMFVYSGVAYVVALLIIGVLAPGLKRAEINA